MSVFIVAFGDGDLEREMEVTQGGVRGKWLGSGSGLGYRVIGLGL